MKLQPLLLTLLLGIAVDSASQTPPSNAPANPQPAAAPTVFNPVLNPGDAWAMRGFTVRIPGCCVAVSGGFSVDEVILTGYRESAGQQNRIHMWFMSTVGLGKEGFGEDRVRAYLTRLHASRRLPELLSNQLDTAPTRADSARCFDYRLTFGPPRDADAARANDRNHVVGSLCQHPGLETMAIDLSGSEMTSAEPSADWQQAVRTAIASVRFLKLDDPSIAAASEAFKSGDNQAGRAALEQSANSHPVAAYLLGRRLLLGDGMTADAGAALPHLQRAAEAGMRDAKFLLGMAYMGGMGTPRNALAGAQWIERAADMRHAGAQMEMALMARQPPTGGVADNDRACRYAEFSARNGLARADKLLDEWKCQRRLPPQ